MSLRHIQEQWFEKWDEMEVLERHPAIDLAAPFFSVRPNSNSKRRRHTVLMAGKATHRGWGIEEFKRARSRSISERIAERRAITAKFLREEKGSMTSGFWCFFRTFEKLDSEVIWTNVAKIGVSRPQEENAPIKPYGHLLATQQELARKTLIAEIAKYRPNLVVFVVCGF